MLRFIDFKGFADAQISMFKPLTLLIGKNGSGKSNAIEGVELLAEMAHGRPLYEISDVGRGGGFEVRGGLPGCIREGKQVATFEFGCRLPFEGTKLSSKYTVSFRAKPEPRIAAERLIVGSRTVFTTVEGSEAIESGVLQVRYDNFARGGNKPVVTLPADRSVLSQYESFGAAERLGSARVSVTSLRTFLRAAFVLDPIPKGMRQYDRIGNRVLSRHGGNLSPVLYALEKGDAREKASLTRILGGIKQLPEEPYQSFAFVTTELNDVIFGLREHKGGPIIDARVLSDGTLRCLAVLTAIETAKERSRVVVEEFDNGLHPSRTGVLTQAIWDACTRRKLKILCTTHNPATLDALTKEQLDGVVLAVWDKAQQASRLVRLLDLPRADVLIERGQLGDLVTRRIIDQYLGPDVEERDRDEAKAWLEALPLMLTVLVIDTSYLLELYRVPGFFEAAAHLQVKARFERAVEARSRRYVPFPVLFEVANHIVDGRDDGARTKLAERFVGDVLRSFETSTPFIITPAIDEENLKSLLRAFAEEFAPQRVGLTDGAIVEEARRLKAKYGGQGKVHIWTKDRRLKACEPDAEPNPFVL